METICPRNVLVSFAYKQLVDNLPYKPEYLVLDSGAFTAWNTGKQVDIAAYADWVLEKSHMADKVVAVNLDVIPGEVGRTSTKKERIKGMQQSLKNADYLRSRGLEVMEVFHQDEPQTFLDDLLDRLPPNGYLGISPRNDVNVTSKLAWQDVTLRHLYQKRGVGAFPRCHGLAVTSVPMMRAFPYYSVDSSTWGAAMRYGVYTDEWGKQKKLHTIFPAQARLSDARAAVLHAVRTSVLELEQIGVNMTDLWAKRGIVWND